DVNQGSIAAPVTYDGPSLSVANSPVASDWTVKGDGTGTDSGGGISSISFKNTNSVSAGGANDTLHGPAADSTWTINAVGGGTVAGTTFGGFENLTGAADNKDTFDLQPGGAVAGVIDGGPRGWDTLVVDGNVQTFQSEPTDGNSGTLTIDGKLITYAGLEPITNTGTVADAIFDLGSLPDFDATLQPNGAGLQLTGSPFDLTNFAVPTSSLTTNGR